ncbi:chitosanase, partial [Bacillus thuringiensis]|nr:chitosanase [Bacillus thuringiensis]
MYVTFYVVSILKGADNIMNGKRKIFTCISIVGIGLASFSNSSFAASVTDNS